MKSQAARERAWALETDCRGSNPNPATERLPDPGQVCHLFPVLRYRTTTGPYWAVIRTTLANLWKVVLLVSDPKSAVAVGSLARSPRHERQEAEPTHHCLSPPALLASHRGWGPHVSAPLALARQVHRPRG